MKRYLAYTHDDPRPIIAFLDQNRCSDLIIRRFSNGTEIDFHCLSENILSLLSNKFTFQRLVEFDEEDTYTPEKREKFINSEQEIIDRANVLIAEERYWESHTLLENLWKSYKGDMKQYYQGIILVSASMTQYQMGNTRPAESLYRRALVLLKTSKKGGHILSQIPAEFRYPVLFKI